MNRAKSNKHKNEEVSASSPEDTPNVKDKREAYIKHFNYSFDINPKKVVKANLHKKSEELRNKDEKSPKEEIPKCIHDANQNPIEDKQDAIISNSENKDEGTISFQKESLHNKIFEESE